ncbi:MAG: hypothetical protein L0219_07970 [Phycisphaerales bacterium]|nr:hypothetical protein [Phycisphaerales bacterium]
MSFQESTNKESLHAFVHARFHEAFGVPHNVEGRGEQWTLKPAAMHSSAIHVVLNGTRKGPAVWVFDPHESQTGIVNTAIAQPRQIDELINLIQQRLNMANQNETRLHHHRGAVPNQVMARSPPDASNRSLP